MSDPLVHRHDPAAIAPSVEVHSGARPDAASESPPAARDDDAAQVVTLAQLLATETADMTPPPAAPDAPARTEFGGPQGLEPTRYGDWEKGGRCIDF